MIGATNRPTRQLFGWAKRIRAELDASFNRAIDLDDSRDKWQNRRRQARRCVLLPITRGLSPTPQGPCAVQLGAGPSSHTQGADGGG